MVDPQLRFRCVRDLADESKFWDAELMVRNVEDELARFERGLAHLVVDSDEKAVTKMLRPMPIAPSFEIEEDDEEYALRVNLPGVPVENIFVDVDPDEVEVFACSDEVVCRPYYLSVRATSALDVGSAQAHASSGVLEVRVRKVKKRLVPVT